VLAPLRWTAPAGQLFVEPEVSKLAGAMTMTVASQGDIPPLVAEVWMKASPAPRLWAGLLVWLVSTCVFLWPAVYNGFPLLFRDTKDYVHSAVKLSFGHDYFRGVGYPLWLWATGVGVSVWGPVIAQAAAITALLMAVARILRPPATPPWVFSAVTVLGAALLGAGPRFASGLMPDAMTSWLFLGSVLAILGRRRFDLPAGMAVVGVAVLSHLSHPAVSVAALLPLIALAWPWRQQLGASWRRLLLVGALCVALLPGGLALERALGQRPSPQKWLFVFNSLMVDGVVGETLDAECPASGWVACRFRSGFRRMRDKPVPDWFLWAPVSPIERLGWRNDDTEPRAIVLAALRCCWPGVLRETLLGAARQFVTVDSDDALGTGAARQNEQAFGRFLPGETVAWAASRQVSHALSDPQGVASRLTPWSDRVTLWVALGGFFSVWIGAFACRRWDLVLLCALLMALAISNALVTSFASTLHGRYQARLAWLFVFCLIAGGWSLLARPADPAVGS